MPPLRSRRRSAVPPFTPFARRCLYLVRCAARRPNPGYTTTTETNHRSAAVTEPEVAIQRRSRKRSPSPVSPTSSWDGSDDKEEEESTEIVQADFDFYDPKPGDFHGVKLLLQKYLDDNPWDISGFVDLILDQTTVGTVIKSPQGDENDNNLEGANDDDVYGVITALNLARYSEHRCITDVKDYVRKHYGDDAMKEKLSFLFREQSKDVGLLVCQRFVNCPFQLVPPLYDALFDEISWATEDEPTEELRNSFRFNHYLILTRIYMNKHTNQQKTRSRSNSDEHIIYKKVEDELFQELCSFSFTFNLHSQQLPPPELKNYREMGLLMVVPATEVPKFRKKLKSLLADV